MNTSTSIAKPARTFVASGRVRFIGQGGDLLVAVYAGMMQAIVPVPRVEGVELGDEVELELAADLRSGRILEPKPLPPFRQTKARR
jgi:hypothetical protein